MSLGASKLGRGDSFTYWIDGQDLRAKQEMDCKIPEQVKQSALLVVVLSPAYVASGVCRVELDDFVESTGVAPERIVVVYKQQLVESKWPMPLALRRPRKYQFWDFDQNNNPRTLGWPLPRPTDPEHRPYFLMVEDLCKAMAEALGELKKARLQSVHVGTTADASRKRDQPAESADRPKITLPPTEAPARARPTPAARGAPAQQHQPAPSKVFISYRREDSKYQAHRIYQAFAQKLSRDHVFMDIDSIKPGTDFVDILEGWVNQCEILLALIGPDWLDARDPKSERRRLDNENDFVRIEIRRALTRGIPVVPVLLDRAAMPDASELPKDLRKLVRRQAEFVEFRTFDTDVARLIGRLGL